MSSIEGQFHVECRRKDAAVEDKRRCRIPGALRTSCRRLMQLCGGTHKCESADFTCGGAARRTLIAVDHISP
jgi:hypothetical protein